MILSRFDLKTKLMRYLHWSYGCTPPNFQTADEFSAYLIAIKVEADYELVEECWKEAEILEKFKNG
jgi:hypothetical protein